ncbi:hypothetical protein KC345_g4160 [Hortaea werneckii]|nr:hypothetical protein KC345_g4160 [Hortaea werneckii]
MMANLISLSPEVTQKDISDDEKLLKHQLQPFSRIAALFNRSKPPPALSAITASARDTINLNSHLRMDQKNPMVDGITPADNSIINK